MNSLKPITIVGGGLAGLTLGIALRQRDVPVTIFEAGHYPRHRVCGEFISGHGLEVLEKLGLTKQFFSAGARMAQTAAFFSTWASSKNKRLPEAALCLSRWKMDSLLASEFRRIGGELKENQRWTGSFGEGMVRATGRRMQKEVIGWRWFGLKAHAKNVSLAADLELHLIKNGYVGLCQLNDEEVNVCGLFRSREPVPNLASNWKNVLRGDVNSVLGQRLAQAKFCEDSFCSVAGIDLKPQRASVREELCLGDAMTMIPPLTGNGMSIAFESADLTSELMAQFSRGEMPWIEAKKAASDKLDHHFETRLAWAGRLQPILFQSGWNNLLVTVTSNVDKLWECFFRKTR